MAAMSNTGKLRSLWKMGWIEYPELMAAGAMATFGLIMGITAYIIKDNTVGWNHKYMIRPTVIRSDDPRVPKIQKWSILDQ